MNSPDPEKQWMRGELARLRQQVMTVTMLTEEERKALEGAIGAGLVEFGWWYYQDDPDQPEVTACRKLGLNPTDWHGDPLFDD